MIDLPLLSNSYSELQKFNGISFTKREIDIMACIAEGRTATKSIANFLCVKNKPISYKTVDFHVQNVTHKLYISSRDQIREAIEKSNRKNLYRQHYEILKFDHILQDILLDLNETIKLPIKVFMCSESTQILQFKQKLEEIIEYLYSYNLTSVTLEIISKNSTVGILNNNDALINQYFIYDETPYSSLETRNIYYLNTSKKNDVYRFILYLVKHLSNNHTLISQLENQLEKFHNSSSLSLPKNLPPSRKKMIGLLIITTVFSLMVLILFSIKDFFYLEKDGCLQRPTAWNIPTQNIKFIGREATLKNLYNQFHVQHKNNNQITAVSVCAGLGGVGKTQLCIQYAKHSNYPYTLKAWFSAENIPVLRRKYIEFAEKLGIQKERHYSEDETIGYVKKWLSEHPGWLLIFDNVENHQDVEVFLPEVGGDILITTRTQHWPTNFHVMKIDIMTEEESIDLLKSIIKDDIRQQIIEAKMLVQKLGFLPLAISQAAAYILQTKISIKQYLDLYQQHEFELLSAKTFPAGVNTLPVAVTWNISLERIVKELQMNKEPLLAIELLTVCAYLSPDRIKHEVLLTWLSTTYPQISPKLVLYKHLSLLQKYSLINENEDHVSIHRLVQTVLRFNLKSGINKPHPFCSSIDIIWFENLLQFFLENENEFKLTNSFEQLLSVRDQFKNNMSLEYTETLARLDLCIAPIYFFQERYDEYFNLLNTVNHFLMCKKQSMLYLQCKLLYLYSAYYRKKGQYVTAKERIDGAMKLIKMMPTSGKDKKLISDLAAVVLFNKANLIFVKNTHLDPERRNITELKLGIDIVKEALEISKKNQNVRTWLRSIELYGRLENLNQNPDAVILLFDKTFKQLEAEGDKRTKMLYYMTYADAYKLKENYNRAIQSLESALTLAKSLNLLNDIEKLQNKIKEFRERSF